MTQFYSTAKLIGLSAFTVCTLQPHSSPLPLTLSGQDRTTQVGQWVLAEPQDGHQGEGELSAWFHISLSIKADSLGDRATNAASVLLPTQSY